jgi:hypothetical protein
MEGSQPPTQPPGPSAPAPAGDQYPVNFSVDYPDRDLDRLTTFFRIFMVIPIAIVLATVTGYTTAYRYDWTGYEGTYVTIGGIGMLFIPLVLMLLFRRKYPRWWFDWNRELLRFVNRVNVYLVLMDDRYPSTDEHQSVHVDLEYPDAERELHRALPLVKWLLVIPHLIVLFFIDIAAFVCVIVVWFAILFTGRYPRGLFDFIEGVIRWHVRVACYAVLLVTDRYPPFRLSP